MAELTVNIPDSTVVAVMVAVAFDATGQVQIIDAVDYPHPEMESVGQVAAVTALRKVADKMEERAPGVVTLPAFDDEDESDD